MTTDAKLNGSTYRITFERIGRHHDVMPLQVTGDDPTFIAAQVYRYARKFLASNDPEIIVNLETMTGQIYAGFQNGGNFTLTAIEDANA